MHRWCQCQTLQKKKQKYQWNQIILRIRQNINYIWGDRRQKIRTVHGWPDDVLNE